MDFSDSVVAYDIKVDLCSTNINTKGLNVIF